MQFNIDLIFIQWVIFYSVYDSATAKALVGQNVRNALAEEFPFAACFTERLPQNQLVPIKIMCTGTLLTKRHVLTAAHCTEYKPKNEVQIIIGSIHLLQGTIYYPSWWITFNQWSEHRRKHLQFRVNDIAVTKLTSDVPDTIIPATISALSNDDLYGHEVVVIGWGISNNHVASMTLQTVNLRVLSINDCKSKLRRLTGERIGFQGRNLCTAADPYALIQHGDSGGPLLYANTIVGVNKATIPFPDQPFHPEKLNVHTGIDFYRQFILYVINDYFIWF